jgi:hypothetical protein
MRYQEPRLTKKKSARARGIKNLVGLLVIIVAAMLFAKTTLLSPRFNLRPQSAGAQLMGRMVSPLAGNSSEIPLCEDMVVRHWLGPRQSVTVTCTVVAHAAGTQPERLAVQTQEHAAQIKDAIRGIVGSLPARQLTDGKLQGVKAEIKVTMDDIVGPNLVDDILIPDWHTNSP